MTGIAGAADYTPHIAAPEPRCHACGRLLSEPGVKLWAWIAFPHGVVQGCGAAAECRGEKR